MECILPNDSDRAKLLYHFPVLHVKLKEYCVRRQEHGIAGRQEHGIADRTAEYILTHASSELDPSGRTSDITQSGAMGRPVWRGSSRLYRPEGWMGEKAGVISFSRSGVYGFTVYSPGGSCLQM